MGEAVPLERIDAARQREVARRLREFMPERAVLWAEEDTRPYECDGLTAYRRVPKTDRDVFGTDIYTLATTRLKALGGKR